MKISFEFDFKNKKPQIFILSIQGKKGAKKIKSQKNLTKKKWRRQKNTSKIFRI